MPQLFSSGKNSLGQTGFLLSVLCAIHCISMPLLVVLAPLLGAAWVTEPFTELVLAGLSVGLAVWVLGRDYRRHRSATPLLLTAAGFLLKGIGHLPGLHFLELPLSALGAVGIVTAYVVNWRSSQRYHRLTCAC